MYNLYQRTYGPPSNETRFTKSSFTLFQQKWKAKQLVRAYHGDILIETKFKRRYLPDELPPIVGSQPGDLPVPLASLMFAEVEKRIDTVVFRACFADSIYKARQMVIHGKVSLNGRTVSPLSRAAAAAPSLRSPPSPAGAARTDFGPSYARRQMTDPNRKLRPGDLVTVEPSAVVTLQRLRAAPATESADASLSESGSSESTAPVAESPAPTESADSSASASPSPSSSSSPGSKRPLPFHLPDFAAPFLFIPPYLEPSFQTCSVVYLRDPTARPGVSEVPSPYEADGEVMRLAWVSAPFL